MRHYFLGAAAGYDRQKRLTHTFAMGRKKDQTELGQYLRERYGGEAILCKNGRSALALALKAHFKPGDGVIVNGFTCYAVYEAVIFAGLKPVFVDISLKDLNYDMDALASTIADNLSRESSTSSTSAVMGDDPRPPKTRTNVRGIIVQNTLGNPVDIVKIEKLAKKHGLVMVEDLAHCAGVRYSDGREAGTVGAATALSFGKDKSIDTVSGGAVVFRDESKEASPYKPPRASDHLRAKFYPLFGAIYRGLSYVRLHGVFMRCLLATHCIERSADNRLDLKRKISKFEAKLALRQFKKLQKSGEPPLREFYLVNDRKEVLRELEKNGYYFGSFWYEKPVSPERYYKKVHFPAGKCPNAVYASEHIVNLPTYYSKKDLARALEIIKRHLVKEVDGHK